MTSASLFKWTVALLTVPAVLLSAFVILIISLIFVRGWAGGIGSWGFGVVISPFRITMIAGVTIGTIIVLYTVGRRLIRGQ